MKKQYLAPQISRTQGSLLVEAAWSLKKGKGLVPWERMHSLDSDFYLKASCPILLQQYFLMESFLFGKLKMGEWRRQKEGYSEDQSRKLLLIGWSFRV